MIFEMPILAEETIERTGPIEDGKVIEAILRPICVRGFGVAAI